MNANFKNRKPADINASWLRWGIELETFIPADCGVTVGQYHAGAMVSSGTRTGTNGRGGPQTVVVRAPAFSNSRWRADRDGSIQVEAGFIPCEFVSPIMYSDGGVDCLSRFVDFANAIGAKVNRSCGCHITVGIKSATGSATPVAVSHFIRKLARITTRHAWAIYAQTGTDRHANQYAAPLPEKAGEFTNDLLKEESPQKRNALLVGCGRGIVNFRKAFQPDETAAVEFRAFAGTLNKEKIFHHLATVLGIIRRAATAREVPVFGTPSQSATAPEALQELWQYLGWCEDTPGTDCAYGQFGSLHTRFSDYGATAMKMAKKFETKWPHAKL